MQLRAKALKIFPVSYCDIPFYAKRLTSPRVSALIKLGYFTFFTYFYDKGVLVMKKSISLLLALTMVITSLSIAFPVFADTGAQVDTVVDELSELYQEETAEDKSIEDSAASRVIV